MAESRSCKGVLRWLWVSFGGKLNLVLPTKSVSVLLLFNESKLMLHMFIITAEGHPTFANGVPVLGGRMGPRNEPWGTPRVSEAAGFQHLHASYWCEKLHKRRMLSLAAGLKFS